MVLKNIRYSVNKCLKTHMGEAVRSKFGGTIAVGEAVSVFSVSFPMTFLLSEPVTTE